MLSGRSRNHWTRPTRLSTISTWNYASSACALTPPTQPGSPASGKPKNRLHLDLRPADQGAEVARLQALGARQVSIGQGDVSWVVMADPGGNEFDVLQPLTPDELPPGHDALGRRIAGA